MFGKLVMVVLTIGVCACTLLSLRQARLQAAHELTKAQLRVRECDDRLWALRAEIADRVRPEQVQHMAAALGSFRPMLPLPGDLEKRTAYASANQPAQPDLELEPPIKTQPAGVAFRAVNNTHREPGTRDDRAGKPATTVNNPARPATSKPNVKTKPEAKPEAKPDNKTEAKPDRKAPAKPAADRRAKSDSRRAGAEPTERDR